MEIGLIPQRAWGRNVRAIVSGEVWGRLRGKFGTSYDKWETWPEPAPPLGCNICNQHVAANLHLHEIWEFDDQLLIQTLKGFAAICEDCHDAIHLGRAIRVGLGDKAMTHLARVNGWSSQETAKQVQKAILQWEKRADFDYQLDVSFLTEQGLLSNREIHLNWLTRPQRVFDRLGAIAWAQQILDTPEVVILDTETTGLMEGPMANPNAEVVELAIISSKGRVLYNNRFKPRYSIPQRTTEIHGITNQAVKGAPKFSQEYPRILQILLGKIVVTYNARFDQKVIENTCKFHKVASPDDVMWECAMRVYKAYQEPQPLFSKLPNAKHSAVEDCKATLKLIKKMSKNEEINCD